MTPRAERLAEEAAMLQQAVHALASLTRTPQERLDRALSNFARTFRDAPAGDALPLYERIYAILGNPPVGTPIACRLDTLTPAEQDELPGALCGLAAEITTQAAAAAHDG
jgi:hypothetical protein